MTAKRDSGVGHFIDGAWTASGGPELISINPATEEVLWRGAAAQSAEVERALLAARAAFDSWRTLAFDERRRYVETFAGLLQQHRDDLAQAIHQETGKPLWESRTEIGAMIAKAAVSVRAWHARTGLNRSPGAVVRHRPIGVFAVLGPFNFPGHLPNGHIMPALLAGNTVIFKPSELTPLCGELMTRIWQESGLPAGVLNLLQGGGATGELLVRAPAIDGVLFTGSSATGHAIHKAFGGHPQKMLALEMGGNNPLVVEQVTNVDAAVYTIIQSAFLSAGQRCTCARRLILLRGAGNEKLLQRLQKATAALKVGSGDDCFIGPLVSAPAADRVLAFERKLLDCGGKAIQPLQRTQPDKPFLQPGIIDMSDASDTPDKECFGPLLQVKRVDDLAAAISEANNTRYGLSAGLLSDNAHAWQTFERDVRAGIINWNRPLTGASGSAPFGGTGASGNYRPGAFYAADYSAYPVASMFSEELELAETLAPGVSL